MKISLDGGALCTKGYLRFGNYIFTRNLIETTRINNSKDEYTVYSFCPKPNWLKTDSKMHFRYLRPTTLWLSTRVSLEELRSPKNIFLALNQAIPLATKSKVIAFSHGLSFYYFPQYYADSYHALMDELNNMVKKSATIIVASLRVKKELSRLYPTFKNIKVINFGVPYDMADNNSVLKNKQVKSDKYFLFAGMNNQIKNIEFIISAFKRFKLNNKFTNYKLYLAGNLEKYEDKKSGVFVLSGITRLVLKKLYSQATAYLTASFYESFNFPVLEALSQNCEVVGLETAIIPEFTPYVNVAQNKTDFVKLMTDQAESKKSVSYRDKVLKRFSWNKYFSKLRELY
ncbi:hypothetical protein A2774_04110 [Candidatus Roizmanbacteria bacterium RIFCSPHIGHO2_01_FULL_39_12c]|uniref:Glycosyl transferase family 1 domain-containing protein n=1 Tax=Candidatus Roizmanbacteria bacterium RIFCSPHIGHO2_01_FULL_39_12c TaxID=1802031 RepID=A0A1F7GET3_9BACT|nr:MAG: hypothetical protein A2774_04110 [Candidatus Roizmanbacteria bacterium RIFCSPHIGHO2_01_FULL_39_12c]OGK48080.1 MAG: hypothetical protein A2963_03925 [Candidatus Roizmanbacteria bacterium RIFCSPLOWO2_01_FULL_40_13]